MADILQKLTSTINSGMTNIGRQNDQFKQAASQQNSSISSFMKDIGRFFTRQTGQQTALNNTLSEISQGTNLNSQKIDQSNVLLKDSVTILGQLLGEMKHMTEGMFKLVDITQNGAGFGQAQTGTTNGMLSNIMRFLGMGAAVGMTGFAASEILGPGNGAQNLSTLLSGGNNYGGGATSSGGGYNGAAASGVGSSENASKALDFFQSKGWTKEQAAGIVGNLQAESSKDLNPSSVGDGGKAYGIAQWHPDRQSNFERTYGKSIKQASFEEQLQFIQWELENTEKAAALKLKQAKDAAEAAIIIDQLYERSSGAARNQRVANAGSLLEEKDDSMAPQGTLVQKGDPMGGGSVLEKQAQLAGIRKLPLSPQMRSVLEKAASAAGVQAVVYSGGQPPKGSGGARTGSTRHDNGNAADVWLEKGGRKLADTNPQDKAIMQKFVAASVQAGATGVGAGHGYMGPSNIHVGFGKPASWGGADWIQQAAAGVMNNTDVSGGSGGYASNEMTDTGESGGQMAGGGGGEIPGAGMMLGGGMFGLMLSALSSIGSQGGPTPNRPDNKSDRNNPLMTKEGDDKIAASLSPHQKEPQAINSIRSAAMSSDLTMNNLAQSIQQQAQQQPAYQQEQGNNIPPSMSGNARGGYPSTGPTSSTTPWYMQLAGRLDYSESMKMFKGGVIT